jgi:hypothetical protein
MKIHIIFLFNGIGNQLSQYALYQQLNKKNSNVFLLNNCVEIPGYTAGLDIKKLWPEISEQLLNGVYTKILLLFLKLIGQNKVRVIKKLAELISLIFSIKIVSEENFYEEKGFLNLYVDGWLNKVVSDPAGNYDRIFENFVEEKCEINKTLIDDHSCAIHFRGGDYIDGSKNSQIYGGVADFEFYSRATKKISELKNIAVYVIFTNDISAANAIFQRLDINFILSSEIGAKGFLDDLCSMSYFRNLIMSNSSFSYWSAATFPVGKTVVCPSKYRNVDDIDIYLDNWIQV